MWTGRRCQCNNLPFCKHCYFTLFYLISCMLYFFQDSLGGNSRTVMIGNCYVKLTKYMAEKSFIMAAYSIIDFFYSFTFALWLWAGITNINKAPEEIVLKCICVCQIFIFWIIVLSTSYRSHFPCFPSLHMFAATIKV